MASNYPSNAELLEQDQCNWLCTFQHCYFESVSMQELKELKPLFVMKIYMQFLKNTLNASMDTMRMFKLNCDDHMQKYPDAFEKALFMPRLFRVLKWFFTTCYNDGSFTYTDLMDAKPGRTRIFFNYIIDFIYKNEEGKERIESISNEVERRQQLMAELVKKRDLIRLTLNAAKRQRAEDAIEEEEVAKQHQSLIQEFADKQQDKRDLQESVEHSRTASASLRQQLDARELECVQLCEEVTRLQAAVVTEEEQAALQQRQARQQRLQEDLQDRQVELSNKQESLATTESLTKMFSDGVVPLVTELDEKMKEMCSLQDTGALQHRQSRAMQIIEDCDHQLLVISQREAQLGEDRAHMIATWAKKKQGIEAEVQGSRDVLDVLRNSKEEDESTFRALEKKVAQCQTQLETIETEKDCIAKTTAKVCDNLGVELHKHNMKISQGSTELTEEINKHRRH